MATSRIDDNQLMGRLLEVFRVYGYEGASLSLISEATGLKRASLYHRFPGGKEEMAQAVLTNVDERFVGTILSPLTEAGDPGERVRRMAEGLQEFYRGGKRSCLLDSLSLGDSTEGVKQHVEGTCGVWIKSMAGVAREAGASAALARRRASEAFVRIQGSLVLARATGDTKPFRQALADLPDLLTGGGV